jgi:hypothetical protein
MTEIGKYVYKFHNQHLKYPFFSHSLANKTNTAAKTLNIHPSMALQPFVGSWPIFQFRNLYMQTVGLLGRGISPSQGHYIHRGQHKYRTNAHTDIHALSGIGTHDPSVAKTVHALGHAATVIVSSIKENKLRGLSP